MPENVNRVITISRIHTQIVDELVCKMVALVYMLVNIFAHSDSVGAAIFNLRSSEF